MELTSLFFSANSSTIVRELLLFKLLQWFPLFSNLLLRSVSALSWFEWAGELPALLLLVSMLIGLDRLLLLFLASSLPSSTWLRSIISLISLILFSIFSSSFTDFKWLLLPLWSLLSESKDNGVVEGEGGDSPDTPFWVIAFFVVAKALANEVAVAEVSVGFVVNFSFKVVTSFSASVALCKDLRKWNSLVIYSKVFTLKTV